MSLPIHLLPFWLHKGKSTQEAWTLQVLELRTIMERFCLAESWLGIMAAADRMQSSHENCTIHCKVLARDQLLYHTISHSNVFTIQAGSSPLSERGYWLVEAHLKLLRVVMTWLLNQLRGLSTRSSRGPLQFFLGTYRLFGACFSPGR